MNNFSSSMVCLHRSLVIALGMFFLVSCSPSGGRLEGQGGADEQFAAHRRAIWTMTDKILVALAARQYETLANYIEPGRFPSAQNDPRLIGLMTARRLLGSSAATVIIQQWDADTVEITFDDDPQQASASIVVKHRKGPNRRLQVDQFTFRFCFFKELDQWRLYVP
ncbi:MAG: hypothetical protein K9M57_00065 [Phycisphaerae bacterium]|nr:hypothetical protein [Phycisphaerae bacterium]